MLISVVDYTGAITLGSGILAIPLCVLTVLQIKDRRARVEGIERAKQAADIGKLVLEQVQKGNVDSKQAAVQVTPSNGTRTAQMVEQTLVEVRALRRDYSTLATQLGFHLRQSDDARRALGLPEEPRS